jgi:hypothetical protein
MLFPLNGNSNQVRNWLRSQHFSDEIVEDFADFSAEVMHLMSILPIIFIQNNNILYETINGAK